MENKRKKIGEEAAYWLMYDGFIAQYAIVEDNANITAFPDFCPIGGSNDIDELIRFVREMNLMVIGYGCHLGLDRVKAEFERYVPFNLTIP